MSTTIILNYQFYVNLSCTIALKIFIENFFENALKSNK